MMDLVEFKKEELHIIRNNHQVAKIVPGPATMTALEAIADLYRTIPDDAASGWVTESRKSTGDTISKVHDPWLSS
jgi:hypothetical protein